METVFDTRYREVSLPSKVVGHALSSAKTHTSATVYIHSAVCAQASLDRGKKMQKKTYGTSDSHVVPHHSTNEAPSSLTLQIGRDAVLFAWYGRR